MRTIDCLDNPAAAQLKGVSKGQGAAAVVIIAISVWPCWLKDLPLSTSAGRRFVAARSVNGKGTATTSPGSQITIGLFVFHGGPFVERAGDGGMPCHIE